MKSLKKLLAVLMTITIVAGMLAVPVFAASTNYEDEAKTLYDLDLFKGKSDSEYVPALEDRLLREEGVALLLRMFDLEDEVLAMDLKEAQDLLNQKFTDANDIAAWAVQYVAYAVKNGVVAGRPDGKFAPKDNLLGREYAKMVLAMLGYKQGEDFDYKFSTVELANASGLSMTEASRMDEAVLLRDDVVGMSFAALSAEYKEGPNAGKKVIDVIVGDDQAKKDIAIAAGLVEVPVIVSVEALSDIEINVGEELTLPAKVKITYSDGTQVDVDVEWPSVDVSQAMEKTEIIGTIAGTDAVAKVNITINQPAVEEPEEVVVNSVVADSLVEVKVEYNQDVSGNSAVANKDNYALTAGTISSVSVSGNVAIIALDTTKAPANQTPAKLTVNNILASSQQFDFTYFDATLPSIIDFNATGPKEFTVYFDEPIKDKGTVSLKSGTSTLSVNVNGIVVGTASVTIPLYSTLVDGKEYVVEIKGFKDYAGYENIIKTITYNYVKDTSAPVAEIESSSQEYVVVKFNKPVRGIVKEMFSHTFTAWTAAKVTSDADGNNLVAAGTSYEKVYVWFYTGVTAVDRPIPEGQTTFRILGKANNSEIMDQWDNKFETADFTISVSADKSAPEVQEIKVADEDQIKVKFNKKVKFENDNIEVLDSEGKAIGGLSLTIAPATEATEFTVTFNKKLAGSTIVVNIKNVYDATLNGNKLDLYSTTLDISDLTKPDVDYVRLDQDNNLLYVFFKEDIDEASGLNVSNYFLKTATEYVKLSKTPEFFQGNKIVKIPLTDAEEGKIDGNTTMFIIGVKDVAGNEISPTVTGKITNISLVKPYMESVNAIARNTIEITFNEQMSLVDKDAFAVIGVAGAEIASLEEQLSGGKTKLILTLDENMGYDAFGVQVQIKAGKGNLLKNLFDVSPADPVTINVSDKIAPTLKSIEKLDGQPIIKLTFEEIVIASDETYSAYDFVITDKDNNILRLGLDYKAAVGEDDGAGGMIYDDVVEIELLGSYKNYPGKLNIKTKESMEYITDVAGNKLAAFAKDITIAKSIYSMNIDSPATITAGVDDLMFDVKAKATTVNTDGYQNVKLVITANEFAADGATVMVDETAATLDGANRTTEIVQGAPLTKDYDGTIDSVELKFSAAGEYELKFTLVDTDNSDAEIASYVLEVTVVVAE